MSEVIEPAVPRSEGETPFFVCAQENYLAYCEVPREDGALDPGGEVRASLDEGGSGPVGMDRRFHVRVRELVYPGLAVGVPETSDVLQKIERKWLYVFRDGALVLYAEEGFPEDDRSVEERAEDEQWTGFDADGSRCWRSADGEKIFLDPGPEGEEYQYTFFLSPVELSQDAIQRLLSSGILDKAGVSFKSDQMGQLIAIPEPFHWAARAHELYYRPAVEASLAYQQDKDRAARYTVAMALKGFLADGEDPHSVRNELEEGKLDAWLTEYHEELAALERVADEAGAYVAHVVQSDAYRIVEQACMEGDPHALSKALQAFASVVHGLMATPAGAALVSDIVQDPDRLVSQYLFTEDEKINELSFAEYRFGHLAAVEIFSEFVPALVKHLLEGGPPKRMQAAMIAYLKNVHIEGEWSKWRHAYQHVVKGQKTPKSTLTARQLERFQDTLHQLEIKSSSLIAPPTNIEKIASGTDRLYRDFSPNLSRVVTGVSFVVELVNLNSALAALSASDGTRGGIESAANFGGAALDMSVFLHEFVKLRTGKMSSDAWVRYGGYAGAVANFITAGLFVSEAQKAGRTDDYGAVAANLTAATGATVLGFQSLLQIPGVKEAVLRWSVIRAMPALVTFISGPPGWIWMAVGAGLTFVGSVLVAWLRDTPLEYFAAHSYFGEDADEDPSQPYWSLHPLPGSPHQELQVLTCLRSRFYAQITTDFEDQIRTPSNHERTWKLEIEPSNLHANSYFEVGLFNQYQVLGKDEYKLRSSVLFIDPIEDRIKVAEGGLVQVSDPVFERDPSGRLTKISVITRAPYKPEPPANLQHRRQVAFVRLVLDHEWPELKVPSGKKIWLKVQAKWDRVNKPDSERLNSLSEDHLSETVTFET